MMMRKFGKLCWLLLAAGLPSAAWPQPQASVDQKLIRVATITEPGLIDFFLMEFLITDNPVTKMEIIDATANGFGVEDIVKCYPSERIYVPTPSDTAQKVMNAWHFAANFQVVTQNSPAEIFEGTRTDAAQNAILAGLLRGLERNYQDWPIKLYFERDQQTATFEIWGYNPLMLKYKPAPPVIPDTVTAYDVVHVLRQDTLIVADTTLFDVLLIQRTVSDTVFVGIEESGSHSPAADPGRYPPPFIQESRPKKN
ncbi:MAG: hypothetical protein ONB48_06135 [candidate division KSB1 bacterium]|nr:hypothetical protein [candidate division KSB1 bacterium]MDZ7285227.1 hypothetical protein [candidate division KSB1 bacterium]MDZ7298259.1 hypothetical protein [candidate division KSB1 bacterium]MDZ7308266.1 hypothetical protein [candidate division KSB1 bacterium]MDZ7349108.1 hypothetical protein [candidate division KSB1 bacterium]